MISAIFAYVITNYLWCISVYIGGGALYAILKWTIQILRLRSRVLAINPSDRQPGSYPGYSDEQYIEYRRQQEACDIFDSAEYPPQVSNNKGTLLFWASFWPFNLVYTLFHDVAREAWNHLYNMFGSMLQAIATAILPK